MFHFYDFFVFLYPRHTDKKENKIVLICKEIPSGASCKVIYEEGIPNIWGNAQIFHHIWGGRQSYMTLQLNFLIYEDKFILFFQCTVTKKLSSLYFIWLLSCFRHVPSLTAPMGVIHQKLQSEDGFLYFTYASQECFGWRGILPAVNTASCHIDSWTCRVPGLSSRPLLMIVQCTYAPLSLSASWNDIYFCLYLYLRCCCMYCTYCKTCIADAMELQRCDHDRVVKICCLYVWKHHSGLCCLTIMLLLFQYLHGWRHFLFFQYLDWYIFVNKQFADVL